MSDYVFEIGEDNFPKFNREYVSMNTSEGLRITIALVVSGIPFSGRFGERSYRCYQSRPTIKWECT